MSIRSAAAVCARCGFSPAGYEHTCRHGALCTAAGDGRARCPDCRRTRDPIFELAALLVDASERLAELRTEDVAHVSLATRTRLLTATVTLRAQLDAALASLGQTPLTEAQLAECNDALLARLRARGSSG